MINRYLDYRRECGEIIKETSPLIREQFDPTDKLQVSNPRKILETTLTKVLRVVAKKALINDALVHKVKLTHGYRKFAITTMVAAGVKDTHRRYLTGHAQVGQDASYVLPSEQDLLTEYVKAIPLLTIDPSQRLHTKINELETGQTQEIARLNAQLNAKEKESKAFWEKQKEQDARLNVIGARIKEMEDEAERRRQVHRTGSAKKGPP